jgi:hypothetical protein
MYLDYRRKIEKTLRKRGCVSWQATAPAQIESQLAPTTTALLLLRPACYRGGHPPQPQSLARKCTPPGWPSTPSHLLRRKPAIPAVKRPSRQQLVDSAALSLRPASSMSRSGAAPGTAAACP